MNKDEKTINWEQRRYEVTLKLLDILPYSNGLPANVYVDEVVDAASYMIKRLKEDTK